MTTNIGFTGLLTLLLIALKLTGDITWSWLWVLAPIWISVLGSVVVCFLVVAMAVSQAVRR